MNEDQNCNCRAACAYAIAVIGSFLIVAGLVWVMHAYTQPAPLGEDRAVVRRKALADVRNADHDALTTWAWQDPTKGLVRLPITNAMDLAILLWHDPVQARSNLVSRVEKAFYVPPPPPNKYD